LLPSSRGQNSNSPPPGTQFPVQSPNSAGDDYDEILEPTSSTQATRGEATPPISLPILVEFAHTGNGLTLPTGGRIGGPIFYLADHSDNRQDFIEEARRTVLSRTYNMLGSYGIPGMTADMNIDVDIEMYAVWTQGSDQVSSLVTDGFEFDRCRLLMETRGNIDRFQLVYVGHNFNGNGNGSGIVAGLGNVAGGNVSGHSNFTGTGAGNVASTGIAASTPNVPGPAISFT
jgi:hypothetical protein